MLFHGLQLLKQPSYCLRIRFELWKALRQFMLHLWRHNYDLLCNCTFRTFLVSIGIKHITNSTLIFVIKGIANIVFRWLYSRFFLHTKEFNALDTYWARMHYVQKLGAALHHNQTSSLGQVAPFSPYYLVRIGAHTVELIDKQIHSIVLTLYCISVTIVYVWPKFLFYNKKGS